MPATFTPQLFTRLFLVAVFRKILLPATVFVFIALSNCAHAQSPNYAGCATTSSVSLSGYSSSLIAIQLSTVNSIASTPEDLATYIMRNGETDIHLTVSDVVEPDETWWYFNTDPDVFGSTSYNVVLTFLKDQDGDGVTCDVDCNDFDPQITSLTSTWYADTDGDGYAATQQACESPGTGWFATLEETGAQQTDDCSDTNANINPGKTEIDGDGLDNDCNPLTSDRPFITTWQTIDEDGNYIIIPVNWADIPEQYNFVVDWGDPDQPGIDPILYNGEWIDENFSPYHEYAQPGVYTVKIYGTFPRLYDVYGNGLQQNIRSIEQWGDIQWQSMEYAFQYASNLVINATDAPDLSNVTSMEGMFQYAYNFNSDISNWDVSTITNMAWMFLSDDGTSTTFNQDISNWNVGNVTTMHGMFSGNAAFNQDLSGWEVSNVTNMGAMFAYAPAFNQNLGSWNLADGVDMSHMLNSSGLSKDNYDATLAGWATQSVTDIELGAENLYFCNAEAHNTLTTNLSWSIYWDIDLNETVAPSVAELPLVISETPVTLTAPTAYNCSGTFTATTDAVFPITTPQLITWTYDDGIPETENATQQQYVFVGKPFITTWQTFNEGGNYIVIPINWEIYEQYDLVVDWGDPSEPGIDPTAYNGAWLIDKGYPYHEYAQPGVYTVKIYGVFPHLYDFGNDGFLENLSSIEQWGDIQWQSMEFAFSGATNMAYNATDAPDLSNVTSMSFMFGCECDNQSVFNQPISHWDVSNVTSMSYMFLAASGFSQNLGAWDISSVTNINGMLIYSGMSRQHYEATLAGWAAQAVQEGITFYADGLKYCDATARNVLVNDYGWTISGDAQDCSLLITAIENKTVDEDVELLLTASAMYEGEGTLAYSLDAASLSSGMIINATTGAFNWIPSQAQVGNHTVTITVNDDGSSEDSYTFIITVNAVNDAPVLAAIGNKEVNEDEELTFTASATDVDSETLSFSLDETSLEKGMALIEGTFTWTPAQAQVGSHEVTITVSDVESEDSETITITVNAVNDAPALTSIGNKSINEDEELTFTASATDVDSETLSFSLDETSLEKGMALIEGTFTWTPAQAQVGSHEVTITVSDVESEDSETFTITVNAVNDAPILTTIGNKEVNEDAELAFTVSAEDVDTESLEYSLDETSSGKGMTLNATSGAFSWIPIQAQEGEHTVTVSVSDGELEDSEIFTITVNAVNDAPILTTIGNKEVNEDAELAFTVSAEDVDTESLEYSLDETSSGKGMTLNATSGAFSWTPIQAQEGEHTVTVSVSDGELEDSETFTITVNAVNNAPILTTIGNKEVNEGTELAFTVTAGDVNSGSLEYSLDETSSGKGMTLNATSGAFSWTPTQAQEGEHTVTVSVSDGELEDSETFTITVLAVNNAPVLSVNAGLNLLQGERVIITNTTLNVTDEDNSAEDIVFTVAELPVSGTLFKNETALALNSSFTQADVNESRISYEHDGFNSAADKFAFTVSDGAGGTIGAADFMITIDIVLSAETGWNRGISLYPMPARKEVTIKVVNDYYGAVSFGIVDLSGREIKTESLTKENPELIHTINIDNVSIGFSFIRVAMGAQLYRLKLLKQ